MLKNAHHENFISIIGLKELSNLQPALEGHRSANNNQSLLHVHSTLHQLAITPQMMRGHSAIHGYDNQDRPYVAILVNLFESETDNITQKITDKIIVQFVEVIFKRHPAKVEIPEKIKLTETLKRINDSSENLGKLIIKLSTLIKDAEIDDKEILENLRLLSSVEVNKLNDSSAKLLLKLSQDLLYGIETFKFKIPNQAAKREDNIKNLEVLRNNLSPFDTSLLLQDNKLNVKSVETALKEYQEIYSRLNSLLIDNKVRGLSLGEKTKEEIIKILNKIEHLALAFQSNSLMGNPVKPKEKESHEDSYTSAQWNRGSDGRVYRSVFILLIR